MEDLLAVVPFVAIVAVAASVVILVVVAHRLEKKRTQAWKALAPTLGLSFVGDDDSLMRRYPQFKTLSAGRSPHASNILKGKNNGIDVCLGEFQYVTGSGKNRQTHLHTICILDDAQLDMPACYLRPQSFFDAIGKIFGGQDIDFVVDLEFSKSFVLQGRNEAAVREHFDPTARAWFVRRRDQGLRLEGAGTALMLVKSGRMKPEQANDFFAQTLDLGSVWHARKVTV